MISAISVQLPGGRLANEELTRLFPEWTAEQIVAKTGIESRPIAASTEYTSDLAAGAAKNLLSAQPTSKPDFLVLCTQTPDYLLPSTACLVHEHLGLSEDVGSVDLNMGCSGYIYALSHGIGLIASQQANRPLVLTADTYSKLLGASDKATRTLFGDAGAATQLIATSRNRLHGFVFGTSGKGHRLLLAENSGMHGGGAEVGPRCGRIAMDGPEIYNFTLNAVPRLVGAICERASTSIAEVDRFVFHQANRFMLESLRRKLRIPVDRFEINIGQYGNTVSSTIPIALRGAIADGRIVTGMRVALVGFGVGLSWGGCILDYSDKIQVYEKAGFPSSA